MPALEPECVPHQMTILVLGSPASGKTQLIHQFADCSFTDKYHSTTCRRTFYTSVGLNERVYQLAIMDLPFTWRNPKLHVQEWENVSDVDAFILVLDLTCEESFSHLKKLRDQLNETLHLNGANNGSNGVNGNLNGHVNGNNSTGIPLIVIGTKYDLLFATRGHLSRRYLDNVNVIKKQWKWPYVECSAAHNWQVQNSFKTLIKLIDSQYFDNRPGAAERLIPGVLRRNRCTIC